MKSPHRRVAAGPSGGFDLISLDSGRAGPRVVVLGGVHGDETEGALAAGRMAATGQPLLLGRVDVVPICHEVAFQQDSRVSPLDGGNLARVFPGDVGGTPTEQLAHHLYTEVLHGADFLVDLHTSGQSYDMPFLAGYRGRTRQVTSPGARGAVAFGADFVWRHPGRSEGRTLSVVENGIYCESPGGGPVDPATVDAYFEGVLRVLAELGMVRDVPPAPTRRQVHVTGGGDLDRDMTSVDHDGFFLAEVARGQKVVAGQPLGKVIDAMGRTLETHAASSDGWIMALKRRSPVRAGDLVACLAEDDEGFIGSRKPQPG